MNWFNVDKKGLAQLLERQGKAFAIYELLQNALDEKSRFIDIKLERIPNTPFVTLRVEDDNPEGFKDLSHAFTLFASSEKKSDPNKRGRFNFGEKLVLAICESASIESTKGTILFDKEGRRNSRKKRDSGSVFTGKLRMTNGELLEAIESAKMTIIPSEVEVTLNGEKIEPRKAVSSFEETLQTEIADSEGFLKKSQRKTLITIHEVQLGEEAHLFEMGIPVVKTGDSFHVNIHQKVPLNFNRDNVTPAYLKAVRAIVLNNMHQSISESEASESWVREALSDDRISDEAVISSVKKRFGEKAVAYDPSDPEANKLAVSKGFAVVHGGHLSASEWKNIKRAEALLPSGRVTPSPQPYSLDPLAKPVEIIERSDWSEGMIVHAELAEHLGELLLGCGISVRYVRPNSRNFSAAFGSQTLDLAFNVLGSDYFEKNPLREEFLSLLIHEFGHHYSGDHLSSEYHDALCKLGAKLALHFEREREEALDNIWFENFDSGTNFE